MATHRIVRFRPMNRNGCRLIGSTLFPIQNTLARATNQQCLDLMSFSTVPSVNKNAQLVPAKSAKLVEAGIDLFWNRLMHAEEEALRKLRPWVQLDLFPRYNFKEIISSVKGECMRLDFAFASKKYEEQRALMNPKVHLLHYPFEPATSEPEGFTKDAWREAFTKARLFVLGTKHDSTPSCQDVRLLLGAVHADFVLLGLGRPSVEFLIGNTQEELKTQSSQMGTEEWLAKRLAKEGFDPMVIMARWGVKPRIDKLHTLHDYTQKYMAKWSEFRAARDSFNFTIPFCAGFVPGLSPEEVPDRFVDLAEEVLIEEILLACSEKNRIPRFGHEQHQQLLGWTRPLVEHAEYSESFAYKLKQLPLSAKYLLVNPFKKLHEQFDQFIGRELPGFRMAMVARHDRQLVRALHTLMHRGTIEKLRSAQRQNVDEYIPLTVVAIVNERNLPGICDIWNRPEEVYTGG